MTRLFPHSLASAAFTAGAALAGFWDGAVLHQLLAWHHMVCANERCEPRSLREMRSMELPDGLFHLSMWGISLAAMMMLVRAGEQMRGSAAWNVRTAAAWGVMGAGAFQVVEGVVDHLVLRIHRVRPRSSAPLAWDVGFLIAGAVLFGIGAAAAKRIASTDSGSGTGSGGSSGTGAGSVASFPARAWAAGSPVNAQVGYSRIGTATDGTRLGQARDGRPQLDAAAAAAGGNNDHADDSSLSSGGSDA